MQPSRHDRIFDQQLFAVVDAAEYLRLVAVPDAVDLNLTAEESKTLVGLLDKAVQDLVAAVWLIKEPRLNEAVGQ